MKCCNIKWANNKHWFNINQILHLISVETTSSIVLTLIHSKSIQHFIYIVPYKLYNIYPGGCAQCVPSVRKTISNFFIFSLLFFFSFFFPLSLSLSLSICTALCIFSYPFLSLRFASLGAHAICILCCVLNDESVGLVTSLYFHNTERVLLLVFCVIVVVGSNGGFTYLSSSEDGEVGGFASPCVGTAS